MKILLDNGHGENTPGKRSSVWPDGSQLIEWQYTREIAMMVEHMLRKEGVDVERIVRENLDIPLRERCRRVNEICKEVGTQNCLLISIHCNACNGNARGWEVHTYLGQNKSDEYATVFWYTAKELLGSITKMRGGWSDGDPDWDSNFAILRDTKCPALLTENLFMDNEEDCRFLLSSEGKLAIATLHAAAVLKILKL
ncbi:N-acetylmuramoyl-L-alanine amidase [Phocaeicola sartorii]|uniref:N-acetylmuramoyl-L-alanine amidase n=1 Tax=Phocaeicola sartorii TaxID=671267 RepID=UPI003517A218